MSDSNVPVGYKNTEVGIIPEDWEVTTIGDFAPLQRGFDLPTTQVEAGEYPVVYSNGVVRNHKTFQVKGAGIVTGRSGTIGKVHYIENDFWPHNTTLWVTSFGNAHVKFVYYLFKYIGFERFKSGSGVPTLNRNDAHSFKITVPTKKQEQTAIATALSDVDNLIQLLERLIAKKEAIKTATMQQLLTGKTRLPEFATREDGSAKGFKQTELGRIPEDWEVRSFEELLEPTISKKSIKPSTLVTFIGMQDVTGNAQLANQTILSYEKVKSGFTYFEKGDVLLAKITPCFENGKGCHTGTLKTKYGFGSTEFHVLRATEYSDSKFIYFWTIRNSLRIDLESTMVGSAGHRRVPFSAIKSYQIPCPPTKSEQTAIATILSDMDTEIQALQQRLAKTKDIKQGMMQQLLTGRVRLAH